MNEFQVIIHNPETEKFTEVLGISDERVDELEQRFKESLKFQENKGEKGNISELFVATTTICENINEVALVSYMIGGFVEHNNQQHQMDQIAQALSHQQKQR